MDIQIDFAAKTELNKDVSKYLEDVKSTIKLQDIRSAFSVFL